MNAPQDATHGVAPPPDRKPQLHRSPRQKVVAGVCGGLGRYCDIDPVIFRIVLGVLAVTGGTGLIFYGFAWLLLPLEGEEENEARKLLSGRVEGASLIAALFALVGCGLFLSMLGNGGILAFSAMLVLAVIGLSVWTQHRRTVTPEDPADAATAHTAAGTAHAGGHGAAPPEVKAPPTPGSPSWWRDPIVKDGTTGPMDFAYLWGPTDEPVASGASRHGWATADAPFRAPKQARGTRGPRSIGGVVFLLAVLAGVLGIRLSWESHPFGASVQIGLTAALAVFGLGMLVSSVFGRTGFGTLLLSVVTVGLLAGASSIPEDITTHWVREEWRPVSAAAVQPRYALGSGVGRLDLGRVAVPVGRTLRTEVRVGGGRVVVLIPDSVTVKVRARTGVGDIQLPSEKKGDVDIRSRQKREKTIPPAEGTKPTGTVELDLEVGIGQVEVSRATP
ncbi:PspC domain-containing protein [Streptomyces sp. DT24]|uniref:PspC domain-containing protein n=1 Tax=unclassified Streptomyces TaxID=2593676 RepID=UPI003CF19F6C